MQTTLMIKQAIGLTKEQRLAKIAQAEEYVMNYIALGVDRYKQDILANKTNKWMHLYFGMSEDVLLKQARAEFKECLRGEVEPLDSILQKMMDYKLAVAKTAPEIYDNPEYVICFSKGSYIVIAIQKSVSRDKPARGQQIEVSANDTPKFYQRCRSNLRCYAK